MRQIYIIGYYDHKNLGDEQYKTTFTKVLCTYFNILPPPVFIDCDKLEQYSFHYTDIIILGGGDILNRYFLDKVKKVFQYSSNPILAVSVGIPYTDILFDSTLTNLIDSNAFDFIDVIFIRTLQDIRLFNPSKQVYYMPDLSYLLSLETKPTSLQELKRLPKKIIALTLSRHMFHPDYIQEYKSCISSLIEIICTLIHQEYAILMIPFNTNCHSPNENDKVIQNNIYNNIPQEHRNYVFNIQDNLTPEEVLEAYSYVYISIPMRYHSVLFSIYKNIPMIPIYTTRKIQNVLKDCEWPLSYPIPKNEYDVPTYIDATHILNQVEQIHNNYEYYKVKLEDARQNVFVNHIYHSLVKFKEILFEIQPKRRRRNQQIQTSYYQQLCIQVNQAFQTDDFRTITDIHTQKLVSQYISYFLTRGLFDSKYTLGLMEKMFKPDYDYEREWNWVLRDDHKRQIEHLYDNTKGWLNLNFINDKPFHQDNPFNVHRSGWQYVFEHLKTFHNNNASIFLDLYVDRTFHWNYEINKYLKIVPYNQPWIGFVHHTFDASFSTYNNKTLLENPDFISSLKYCKGLIVLSKYIQELWIQQCIEKHIHIPIYRLVHPTEINVPTFSYKKFIQQEQPKIIHIGGWLRDVFAFYNLEPKIIESVQLMNRYCFDLKTVQFKKVAIKGQLMNNYFPPKDFSERIEQTLLHSEQQHLSHLSNTSFYVSHHTLQNNWSKQFQAYVSKYVNTDNIEILEHLSNEEYDQLLSENIVFIYLIDASAVNTLIECIVRNTPILINRHPAVVELLGEDYPLYYGIQPTYFEMNQSIQRLLQQPKIIWKAYRHLTRINKNQFHIDTFIQELEKLFMTLN